jgi:hypothetical protein
LATLLAGLLLTVTGIQARCVEGRGANTLAGCGLISAVGHAGVRIVRNAIAPDAHVGRARGLTGKRGQQDNRESGQKGFHRDLAANR